MNNRRLLRSLAVLGNVLFLLWIWRNGINEGLHGTTAQIISLVLLTTLLVLNAILLW